MKVLGTIILKIDGALYKTVPDSVELMFGGFARTAEVADNTVNHRDGVLVPSKVTAEVLHTEKTDIKKLNDLVGGMVEVITDIGGGITYTIQNATRTGDPIMTSSSNGRIKFQAEGDPIAGL